jgi:hypothetical protein
MWYDFRWIDSNEEAIAEHNVSKGECKWVVNRYQAKKRGDRFTVVGRIESGRKIKIVFEKDDRITVWVVTAYDVR